eukprot:1185372-Prorocentrum_minimum.AAC.3
MNRTNRRNAVGELRVTLVTRWGTHNKEERSRTARLSEASCAPAFYLTDSVVPKESERNGERASNKGRRIPFKGETKREVDHGREPPLRLRLRSRDSKRPNGN